LEVICEKCGYILKKYNNIFGTRCIKCNSLIKPEGKPKFLFESELKRKRIEAEFLKKMKKRFKENNDGH